MPTELFCSIKLAGGSQMDKGLESLDNLAKSVDNLGGGPISMHDSLGK